MPRTPHALAALTLALVAQPASAQVITGSCVLLDVTGGGYVDSGSLSALISSFYAGHSGPDALFDINGNNRTDAEDLAVYLASFMHCTDDGWTSRDHYPLLIDMGTAIPHVTRMLSPTIPANLQTYRVGVELEPDAHLLGVAFGSIDCGRPECDVGAPQDSGFPPIETAPLTQTTIGIGKTCPPFPSTILFFPGRNWPRYEPMPAAGFGDVTPPEWINIWAAYNQPFLAPTAGDCSPTNTVDILQIAMPLGVRANYTFAVAYFLDDAVYSVRDLTITLGCPADFTADNQVDSGDLGAFVQAFVDANPLADLTNDATIDSGDLSAFVDAFLEGC